ncbi:MAG: hypothetical protein Q8P15_02845 [Nanoarchaeota archaeon]|nr:hypothetical protein [Nanoarchaeota archaeon]
MSEDNNYSLRTNGIKYDSSDSLTETRDELGTLLLRDSLEKGRAIEFPSLGIIIQP